VPLSSASGGMPKLFVAAVVLVQLVFAAAQLVSLALSRDLWIADLANFIRPHLLVAGVVLFVVGFVLPPRSTKIAGTVALLAAGFPYFLLPSPAPAAPGTTFTMISANVLTDNLDPRPFLALPDVGAADILVLQEVRPLWQNALIASGRWPFESSRDLAGNTDMKVLSRFPILDERTVSSESTDTYGRFAVRYELSVEGTNVVLYAIHPQTPRGPRAWEARAAYLRDLEAAVKSEPSDALVVVAGDWNTPPWSPFFRDFLSSTGYRTTESRWWPLPTRFSIRLWSLTQIGTPIDRIVLSPTMALEELALGPKFGSNHLPVVARVVIPD
jgi:endonuclease/exonuclease/phosphatase (EEP) superfamily protein YafD